MKEPLSPELLGQLLGLVAHDLRNPLAALLSNVEFLGGEVSEPDAEVADAVNDSLVSLEGLVLVIDNLNTLGLALSGSLGAGDRRGHVAALVLSAVEQCDRLSKSHGVKVVIDDSARRESLGSVTHRDLIERSLSNLLRNGLQHAPPGSVVTVSCSPDTGRVFLCVEDHGHPLPAEHAQGAFTAEGQLLAKSGHAWRYGRGLGLYCAAITARGAGGTVRVAECRHGGSCAFELEVPVHYG